MGKAVQVAFMLDKSTNDLLEIVAILARLKKVRLLNMAIKHFLNWYIKENHLELEVKELQSIRNRRSKKESEEE